ncbi:hypothetical protein GNP80_18375 [Aliivibrio fischeri]|uniref:hypothetical protein n=1 Tax=Aliivibrio fischeri TaxID=668 RepID=UPI0012DA9395|nr:hypothetical protein [Aliivibrio fischeri]MUK94394.1 hypothetical protein [Aliivibrio fischeri]
MSFFKSIGNGPKLWTCHQCSKKTDVKGGTSCSRCGQWVCNSCKQVTQNYCKTC